MSIGFETRARFSSLVSEEQSRPLFGGARRSEITWEIPPGNSRKLPEIPQNKIEAVVGRHSTGELRGRPRKADSLINQKVL